MGDAASPGSASEPSPTASDQRPSSESYLPFTRPLRNSSRTEASLIERSVSLAACPCISGAVAPGCSPSTRSTKRRTDPRGARLRPPDRRFGPAFAGRIPRVALAGAARSSDPPRTSSSFVARPPDRGHRHPPRLRRSAPISCPPYDPNPLPTVVPHPSSAIEPCCDGSLTATPFRAVYRDDRVAANRYRVQPL